MSAASQEWLNVLGDLWYSRNKHDLGKQDLVSQIIEYAGIKPIAALEVGCCNGWLLKKLEAKYGCRAVGIDPSQKAIADADDPSRFRIGVSTAIPLDDASVDLVIMGFSLWATPPEDWFKTVAEVDRVLVDGGHLVIHDHASPRFMRRMYVELKDGRVFHQFYFDWVKLWTVHPAYSVLGEAQTPGTYAVVSAALLKKSFKDMQVAEMKEPEAKQCT